MEPAVCPKCSHISLNRTGGYGLSTIATGQLFQRILALETREGAAAGVASGVVEFLFDAQELVVLGDALGAGRGTGLDLARVGGNGDVSNGGVLGFAGAVRGDG